MAYDTKRRWSRVFVRTTASEPRHARRLRPAAPAGPSVNETIEEFLEAVDDGWARDRYGRSFTHEAAHDLHWYLRGHFGEALGAMGLEDVRRRDLETLAESGMSRHRQRVLATSVRALYDYAIERRLVRGNPAERVAIPDDHHPSDPSVLHHGIELVLRVATLGFALSALILLTESL
jgi:site-specific recombinase XerD